MSATTAGFKVQPYRRSFLKSYYSRMSKDNLGCLWDDHVAAVLEQQGYSIEQAPRSVYKVEKLFEWLHKYSPEKSISLDMTNPDIIAGIALAYACFAKPKGEPFLEFGSFTPDFILSITSNRQGSPGLTAYGLTKIEAVGRAYERGMDVLRKRKAPEPCLAFKRTQFDDKTRLVWGFPYSMTAIEGLFARPLIDRFLELDTPMAFGQPDGVLGVKLRVDAYSNRFAYSTDVSSFDSSISASLIKVAFSILSTWFDFTKPLRAGELELDTKEVWDKIVGYFITTPIVMPDGNLYRGKRHGVPSGSYFTQMVDSLVNTIIVGAISMHFGLNVSLQHFHVLGDDVIFWSNKKVPLDEVAQYASQLFGMTFNAQKSGFYNYDEPVTFLGRNWYNGIPDLPIEDILKEW